MLAQVAELLKNSAAELCWYFTATREQFRISGHVTVVGPRSFHDSVSPDEIPNYTGLPSLALQQQRVLAWRGLSDAARASYLYRPLSLPFACLFAG